MINFTPRQRVLLLVFALGTWLLYFDLACIKGGSFLITGVRATSTMNVECALKYYYDNLKNQTMDLQCMQVKLLQSVNIYNMSLFSNDTRVNSIASTRAIQLERINSSISKLQLEIQILETYCTTVSGLFCGCNLSSSASQSSSSTSSSTSLSISTSSSSTTNAKITIIDTMNGKMYRDGTIASSCNDYRYPSNSTFVYSNEGSGYYQIKQNKTNVIVRVYCDMESDGGGWTVIGNWINNAAQYLGMADLAINFFGLNYAPKHTQTMSYLANSLLKYAWIYNSTLPSYPMSGSFFIQKHFKTLYNATGIITCNNSWENGIGGNNPVNSVIFQICEPVFGVPVSQLNCGTPIINAIHVTNMEFLDSRYVPPSCTYRCGPVTNNGVYFRLLVR